jgi:hypothetical protein
MQIIRLPVATYFLNVLYVRVYAESSDVSYVIYINMFVNTMDYTHSSDRIIRNNGLGEKLRKITIKVGSFLLSVFIKKGRIIK